MAREDGILDPVKRIVSVALFGLAMAGVSGCHGNSGGAASQASVPERHSVRGQVLAVDAASGMVTLKHDAIPGFMEAMTMGYRLADKSVVGELHPHDVITATLLNDCDDAGPKNLRLTDIVIVAQAKPDYKPKIEYHVPAPGEVVPHFALRNQDGKTIYADGFKGQVTAITFVYTRCPLPDFCIRMSRNFSKIEAAHTGAHLLTISFDPENDTPKVLRDYGNTYLAKKNDFRTWDFAVPAAEELPKVEQWFDLGVMKAEGGAIQHSVSTVIVDNKGRVRAFYPTNEWTVDQALADIKKAGA